MSLGDKIRNLTSDVRFQSKECYLLAELAAKIADSKIDDYVGEDEFSKIATPLIKYLRENYHPHATIIIDYHSAEIVEGVKVVNIDRQRRGQPTKGSGPMQDFVACEVCGKKYHPDDLNTVDAGDYTGSHYTMEVCDNCCSYFIHKNVKL